MYPPSLSLFPRADDADLRWLRRLIDSAAEMEALTDDLPQVADLPPSLALQAAVEDAAAAAQALLAELRRLS